MWRTRPWQRWWTVDKDESKWKCGLHLNVMFMGMTRGLPPHTIIPLSFGGREGCNSPVTIQAHPVAHKKHTGHRHKVQTDALGTPRRTPRSAGDDCGAAEVCTNSTLRPSFCAGEKRAERARARRRARASENLTSSRLRASEGHLTWMVMSAGGAKV